MTRLPPRPLLDPAMIAKNWIFCPGRGTLPELLLLCSDVDVVRLRRGLGEGEGAAETGAKECWSSRAAQLGWRLRRPRPAIVITASHSAAAAAARRGPALAWRNHQVGAAAVAGNSNKELMWLVEVVCSVQWCWRCVWFWLSVLRVTENWTMKFSLSCTQPTSPARDTARAVVRTSNILYLQIKYFPQNFHGA